MEIERFPRIPPFPSFGAENPKRHIERCESVFTMSINRYAVRVEDERDQDFLTTSCTITIILPRINPPATVMQLRDRRLSCQNWLPGTRIGRVGIGKQKICFIYKIIVCEQRT